MKDSIRLIRDQVQGDRVLAHIQKITPYHRIQASPGYRAAAGEVLSLLEKASIPCRIRSYPFDEDRWYLSHKAFLEWDCQEAWLELERPVKKRLADFQSCGHAIIQRSFPTDHSIEPVDLVFLDRGADPKAYPDLDLKGKLLFIREDFQPYMDWAIKEGGALGFVSDYLREVPGVRTRADLYDARNYSSFWWKDTGREPNTFGFVLTPRQGDELAALCQAMAKAHKEDSTKAPYPKARFKVDARLYPGAIEVVEAWLPGQREEEILLVAHLCHPHPSANDNASGVGAALEALTVLKRLLDDKELKALKRGIRVLFVPEFAGTYAWLADDKNAPDKVLAGLNLDMVGGRQTKGVGPLTIGAQPHAAPSIVTDMAMLCFDEIKNSAPSLNPAFNVPMFNLLQNDFSAGSDHQVLSDPTIDIPSPMLGQWPDRHYHSSADTLDCLDPDILHKSASLAASYCYSLANLDEADVFPLLAKAWERAVRELAAIPARFLNQEKRPEDTWESMTHCCLFFQETFRDLKRFFESESDQADRETMINSFCDSLEAQKAFLFKAYLKAIHEEDFVYKPPTCPTEYAYIPKRTCKSPILHLEDYLIGNDALTALYVAIVEKYPMEYFQVRTLQLLIEYYIDGQRTLWDIAREVMRETGSGSLDQVHDLVQLLVKLGTVKIIKE